MVEVPQALKARLRENARLSQALLDSGLPLRFQAMVLGLATIKQANAEGGASPLPPRDRPS